MPLHHEPSGPAGKMGLSPDRPRRPNDDFFETLERLLQENGISEEEILSQQALESLGAKTTLGQAKEGLIPVSQELVDRVAIAIRLALLARKGVPVGLEPDVRLIAQQLHGSLAWHPLASINEKFFQELAPHLDNLKWTDQRKLSAEWGYSEAMVSGFRNGSRHLHVEHINRLAIAMAQAYDQLDTTTARGTRGSRFGIASLHVLLDALLAAAGYSVFVGGREQNLVWKRLMRGDRPEDRVLRVGYFLWPPLIESVGTEVRGVAAELMELVARLLGVTLDWHPVKWPNIEAPLVSGDIDLYPPILLRTPLRMLDVGFTRPVPGLQCHPVGLFAAGRLQSLLAKEPIVDRIAVGNVDSSKLVWVVGKSELTRYLARILDPIGEIDTEPGFFSIADGCRFVLREPFDARRKKIRVVATEHYTADYLESQPEFGGKLARLLDGPHCAEIGISLAFAAHPAEPQLIRLINGCIREFKEHGRLVERILSRHSCGLSTSSPQGGGGEGDSRAATHA